MLGCKPDIREKISKKIDEKCKMKENDSCGSVISLDVITDFQWDKFYYFNSGTSLEKIDSSLGFHYPYWEDLSETLIFTLKNKIVHHEEFAIEDSDGKSKTNFRFNIQNHNSFYTPQDAIFYVSCVDIKGNKYYMLTNLR